MKYKILVPILATISTPLFSASDATLQKELQQLKKETRALQNQLKAVVHQLNRQQVSHNRVNPKKIKHAKQPATTKPKEEKHFRSSLVSVHVPTEDPKDRAPYHPKGLIANGKVITYLAGTPVVRSPFTGKRPAFDGSDYIVNISSINRDVRLLEQRRSLFAAYRYLGYPEPKRPILALSGKVEPVGMISKPFVGDTTGDINLGSSEIDVDAVINKSVEGFIAIVYDDAPPLDGGPRVSNSVFRLNLGFINIGDLDKTPFYFTAGQLYVPYGRYASAMVSSPLTVQLMRTKTRTFMIGYKSQNDTGPFLTAYGFRGLTTVGASGVGGLNGGYLFSINNISLELGGGYIYSINDAANTQRTDFGNRNQFGGFGSFRGTEDVGHVPGANAYGILRFDRYNLTAEWVGATQSYRVQDLSFNGYGARPSAGQLEIGATFHALNKPASVGLGYQWSKDSLALGIPKRRISGVFNISLWRDTVQSIEYRHDTDYRLTDFGNGAPFPGTVNANIYGTGGTSDTVSLQLGVFF